MKAFDRIANLLILTDSVVAIETPQLRLESQDFEACYCGDKRLCPMLDDCTNMTKGRGRRLLRGQVI